MNQEVIALVDKALANCSGRDNVSSHEMMDMLLDIRLLLNKETEVPA
jgi:hypothetical protein